MSEPRRGKKRPKSYYIKCAGGGKKSRHEKNMCAGMKGFLVTCNKYERETVREMYNLLNEYADLLYGPELNNQAERMGEGSDSDEDDMEKAMANETMAMKQQTASATRRFQNTETKCKNVIFIRTTVADPCRLAHTIFSDIQEKQVQKARYALRMLPISVICPPVMKEIEKTLRSVLAPHFETEFGVGIKYTAACKIRNNNSLSKNTILPALGKIIKEMNPLHSLCYDEPDLVIVIEVVNKACCFSVVKDFFKFRRYNLHEIVKKTEEKQIEEQLNKTEDRENDDSNQSDAQKRNKNDEKNRIVQTDDIIDNVEEINKTDEETKTVHTDAIIGNVEEINKNDEECGAVQTDGIIGNVKEINKNDEESRTVQKDDCVSGEKANVEITSEKGDQEKDIKKIVPEVSSKEPDSTEVENSDAALIIID